MIKTKALSSCTATQADQRISLFSKSGILNLEFTPVTAQFDCENRYINKSNPSFPFSSLD